jgi:phage N-6-adenine-methyltransferase
MARNKAKEHRNPKQDWGTPWDVFSDINECLDYQIFLDVCASAENTKCPNFIHKDYNSGALVNDWVPPIGGFWYCNPPFDQVEQFLMQAWRQFNKGYEGMMLVPSNQEVNWFRDFITYTSLRRAVYPRRIQFIHPETGEPATNNTIASVIVAFVERTTELHYLAGEPWVVSVL